MSRASLAPYGALLLGWVLFWWPVIGGDQLLFVRDLTFFALPAKRYLLDRLAAGEIPLWTSLASTGMPFLADLSNQVLYPLNLVLAVAPSTRHGLSWFVILHSLLGLFAFFALARTAGVSRAAAAWAALIYGLSGYTVAISDNINYLPAVVWVPWGLASAIRGMQTGDRRYPALGALCLAFLVLAGDTLDAAILVLIVILLGLGALARPAGSRPARRTLLLHPLGMAALGAMLVAVQAGPTAELVGLSVRRDGLDYAMISEWSFPPARLLELVQPYFFGSNVPAFEFAGRTLYAGPTEAWANSVYVGLIPVLLAAVAVVGRPRRAAPWILLLSGSLILSFGRHLPGFRELVEVVPFVGTQRFPEKLVFWSTLALSLLAGLGAHLASVRLRRAGGGGPGLGLTARVGVSVGLPLLAYYLLLDLPARAWIGDLARRSTLFWAARGFPAASHFQVLLIHLGAVLAVIVAMAWVPPRWRRAGLGALLAASVADLAWVHYGFNLSAPSRLLVTGDVPDALQRIRAAGGAPSPRIYFDEKAPGYRIYTYANAYSPRILRYYRDPGEAARRGYRHLLLAISLEQRLAPNAGARFGVSYLNGRVSPLQPMAHRGLEDGGLAVDPWHLMATSAVGWVISSVTPWNRAWDGPGFVEVVNDPARNLRILAVEDALPRVFLAPREGFRVRSMRGAPSLLPGLGPGQRRLELGGGDAGGGREAVRALRARLRPVEVRSSEPERRIIELDSPFDSAYLVLVESLFPGWTATLDGRPVPLHLVNDRFMAVSVPAGRHRIELRYHSTYLAAGVWVSLAGLALCAWMLRPR